MTNNDDSVFTRDLLIAIALFFLGDKIVTISKLAITAYDCVFNDCSSQPQYVLEISLASLAIGISAVTLISAFLKNENAQTIIIGVIISSIAGFISISEAAFLSDNKELFSDVTQRAFFFFFVYIGLFLVPIFLFKAATNRLDLSPLLISCLGLMIGAVLGFTARLSIIGISWILPVFPDHDKGTNILDEMRFRPGSLVVLGTVWTVVALLPYILKEQTQRAVLNRSWAFAVALSGGLAGYLFCRLIESPEGKDGYSSHFLALGYGIVGAMPALSIFPFADIVGRNRTALVKTASISAVCVGIAAFATLAGTVNANLIERLFIGACFALCGLFIALATHLTVHYFHRWKISDA